MALLRLILVCVAISCLVYGTEASEGDSDPLYKACVERCEKTGCVGDKCSRHCKFSSDGKPIDGPWYMHEPLYLKWKQWDCRSDCLHNCMLAREEERKKLGASPIKYHGRWPFQRVYGIQEPVAVALCALNLAVQFHGWVSFSILIYYKLPLKPDRSTYYEYTGLLHIYGLLAMNSLFWSGVFRSRDVELAARLDFSSAAALLAYSLLLSIIRAFNMRDEASRVMVAAPLLAYITTHILYLNFYKLDPGLNRKVCMAISVAELLIWAAWIRLSSHPSRWKLVVFLAGGVVMMLLEIIDFPPYHGFVDSHAVWRACSIPLAYLWWSFIKDDAEFCTLALINKVK